MQLLVGSALYIFLLNGLNSFLPRHRLAHLFVWILNFLAGLWFFIAFGFHGAVLSAATLICMIWETYAPRNSHALVDRDPNTKNASYFLLRRIFAQMATLLLVAPLLAHSSIQETLSAGWIPFVGKGMLVLLVMDFHEYWIHRAHHQIQALWHLHKVHHAITQVSVLAEGPIHFIELIVIRTPVSLALMLLLNVDWQTYIYFWATPSLIFGSFIAHANVDFPKAADQLPWWAHVICTPNFHAHHHTRTGHDRNFSRIFVFWDIFFGTFEVPQDKPQDFGIDDTQFSQLSIVSQQIEPVADWLLQSGNRRLVDDRNDVVSAEQ